MGMVSRSVRDELFTGLGGSNSIKMVIVLGSVTCLNGNIMGGIVISNVLDSSVVIGIVFGCVNVYAFGLGCKGILDGTSAGIGIRWNNEMVVTWLGTSYTTY